LTFELNIFLIRKYIASSTSKIHQIRARQWLLTPSFFYNETFRYPIGFSTVKLSDFLSTPHTPWRFSPLTR
jgi:hypothetical protein